MLVASILYRPVWQLNLADCSLRPVTSSSGRKDIANSQAMFLPDGRHFLWVANYNLPRKGIDIFLSSIDSQDSRVLIHNGSMPAYIPGYIVFVREGKLMAQPFDAKAVQTTAEPFAVLPERIASQHFDGTAVYSVAANGLLVYAPEIEATYQLE